MDTLRYRPRGRSRAALVAACFMAMAAATAAMAAPAVQTQNGVEYITGGVGSDEAAEMKSLAAQWPVTMEFAVHQPGNNDYAAHVQVRVLDKSGRAVLDNVVAQGPFLLARLSPGDYRIEATYNGKPMTRTVNVQPGGHAKATFLWQSGTP